MHKPGECLVRWNQVVLLGSLLDKIELVKTSVVNIYGSLLHVVDLTEQCLIRKSILRLTEVFFDQFWHFIQKFLRVFFIFIKHVDLLGVIKIVHEITFVK